MYKIVNTFNGYEDKRRFETEAEAETSLENDRQEFYECNSSNCIFKGAVVPATDMWYWDCAANQYMWG